MGSKSHVIFVPFPAQGHVSPLMKLAYNLADHGIMVTFVNTESIHMKIMSAMPEKFAEQCPISLVSIPEVLQSTPDGQDKWETLEIAPSFMRGHLQDLIENINQVNNDVQVTHVVADIANGWSLEVAKKMFIKAVAFVPYGLGNLALILHAPKLIEAGIIDIDGLPIRKELICLSEEIPAWNTNELLWSMQGDPEGQKFVFRNFVKTTWEYVRISDSLIVNSFYELESSATDLLPNILPIGPLSANARLGPFLGNLWPEDSTCLSWLDKQPTGSVIYAAFGSTLVCNQQQFNELALGLEMTGQPFLWVVRSGFMNGDIVAYPDGFMERNGNHGKIVEWAPQEKVLAHPSIACYFSHCGWNSTMEGVTNGVPFLCWPYCVDQFHNRDYICEAWKVGLRVIPDENGTVTRHEIKSKIEKLLSDKNIKANSLKLKEMARKSINEGGSSFKNFISFAEQMKQ
ncbi:UDP-glycosyltransferase 83A1 isoform X3 [Ricinus communis]|uniref:UDP-glucuronosyltransferase, putative n=1 Tax=Ricinus communis TaxID=3988 RepID=B9RLR3_RICCO|nr:UDP-glycosyltransferase 83A1 isoform X3 [Ricinus communis]EEF47788.1 UDP-glucuronosyltransferase, putative [Ricinus communis]|eukprot:XP_002514682.1 UDP-glycosyltransferase 83A1 [Ricinus communis]